MILESNPNPNPEPMESDSNSQNPDPNSSSHPQDLTFSYMCENPKLPFQDKGKEVAMSSSSSPPPIERDFLQLKREIMDKFEPEGREKKVKVETLNLSLSLNADPIRILSLPPLPTIAEVTAISAKTTSVKTAYSDDFSYSQSVPFSQFSHNPSCSLTKCSTENYSNDQMWYAGEGTNGSVHSRFRPIGDSNTITFTNPISEVNHHHINNNTVDNINNDGNGSFYRTASSDNISFYPSELPAKIAKMVATAPSSENVIPNGSSMITRPDKLLKEIVCESVPVMAQVLQEFDRESLDSLKMNLKSLMEATEKKEEFVVLQKKLERRSDLTEDTLARANKVQLEIMVAIKTGIVGFLTLKNRTPSNELIEIFMMTRCRNLGCKNPLPVDECDCKICTNEKGFCSACMCPICMKFDCASNTCSWVGCDMCSHWCHALCGLEKNIIRPGPNQKVGNGITEIQFMCPGCGHASEMFGFVKEVFNCCAKDWGLETLMKELDCVRMIFHVSEDFEGKELEKKAKEMFTKLSKKQITPADACGAMLQFFKYGVSDSSVTGSSSKNLLATHQNLLESSITLATQPNLLPSSSKITLSTPLLLPPISSSIPPPPKPTFTLTTPGTSIPETRIEALQPKPIASFIPKDVNEGFQTLETIIRLKEAEAKLFQRLADEARKEVEGYVRIARETKEKMEEEYASKLAKLCLQEAEDKRRKKLEELKFAENSHGDYQNMKVRMQAEIANLLQRMEATKKQWA